MPYPCRRLLLRLPAVVIVVVALVLSALATPAVAANAVSGTVTDLGGVPLAGVRVDLVSKAAPSTAPAKTLPATPANGAYSFTDVAAGDYLVRFTDAVTGVSYFDGTGQATATDPAEATPVTSGATDATATGARLASRTVKGRVTVASDGAPIPGTAVKVLKRTGEDGDHTFAPATTNPAAVTTDDAGDYALTVADADNLVLEFSAPGYETAYANGAGLTEARESAAPMTFAASGATTEHAALTPVPGTVSGTVVRGDSARGTALHGATVELLKSDGTSFATRVTTTTDEKGAYALQPNPGTYKVVFTAAGYDPEYYDEKETAATASPVTVTAGTARTAVNGTLVRTATSELSGVVTNGSGAPIQGVTVSAHRRTAANGDTGSVGYDPALGTTTYAATTDGEGAYALDVPPGRWIVQYKAPAFPTTYWNGGGAGTSNPATAPEIEMVKGTGKSANVSIPVNSGAIYSGKVVTGTPAQPVKGVEVRAEYAVTQPSGATTWQAAATATTADDGGYTITLPVVAGRSYVLGYYSTGFPTRYFEDNVSGTTTDGVPSRSEADAFRPPAPTTQAQPLDTLRLVAESAVTGKVTDRAGSGLAGVQVQPVVYDRAAKSWKAATAYAEPVLTGTDGRYTMPLESDGIGKPFRLQFAKAGRETRYFPSATVADEATNVTVAKNEVVSGRDATLPTLAVLAGSLTEANGSAYTGGGTIRALRLVTYTEDGEGGGPAHTEWRAVASSDLDGGGFSFSVPSGSYRLLAELGGSEKGFLPGLVGLDQAPSIGLGEEQRVTQQTYALPSRAQVRGVVTNVTGAPMAGRNVTPSYRYVVNVVDGAPVLSDWTEPAGSTRATQGDGSFVLNLRSRSYRVGVPTETSWWTSDGRPAAGPVEGDDVTVGKDDVTGVDIRVSNGNPVNLQAPYITGIAAEGETLTAEPGRWSAADVQYTYQWFQSTNGTSYSAISGATGKTYAIPGRPLPLPGLPGFTAASYRVVVTATRSTSTTANPQRATATSKPTGKAVESGLTGADTDTENRQLPQVTGRAAVGETLTGTEGQWSEGGTFTYQWLADGATIADATGKELVLTGAQVGKRISLKVTETSGTTPAGGEAVVSEQTAPVARGALRSTALPTIAGDPAVGSKLTATPGTWNAASPSFGYEWLVNGQVVPGATGSTYTPVDADLGKQVAVRVTATSAPAYTAGTATSESTAPVKEDPTKVVNRTRPVLSGTPEVGETLSATTGSWTNEPTGFGYQWLADGNAIGGATSATYVPTDAVVGRRLSVRVTATKAGLTPGSAVSDQTLPVVARDAAPGAVEVTRAPSVTGTARVGQWLTAWAGSYSPSDATATYAWLRNGRAIPGATGARYRVTTDDLGSRVGVRVTYTHPTRTAVQRTATLDTVVRSTPRLATKVAAKGRKAVLRLVVTAVGADPTGRVRVVERGRVVASGLLRDGRVRLVVAKLRDGRHTFSVRYAGDRLTAPGSRTVRVSIPG